MRYLSFLLVVLISQISMAKSERLVSIDGSITEIVYALGVQDELVAVDSTSVYPAEAKKLPNVGYMRALSAEGILSIQPTTVITSSSAGPKNVLEQLTTAGVAVHIIKTDESLQGLQQKVLDVGALVNKNEQAKQLNAKIDAELKPLVERINSQKKAPKTLFFLGVQGNQLMAAGSGTKAQALLDILQLQNELVSSKGYKPLSKESILSINPEVVIVAVYGPMNPDNVKKQFQHTKAYADNKVIVINSGRALGFGPSMTGALAELVAKIYGK